MPDDASHAHHHHRQGNQYHDAGDLERAIKSYRRALRERPEFPEALNDLGTAYYAKGQYGEAERTLRQAVTLDSAHGVAFANLGAALRAQGKFAEARRAYQRALWLRVIRWFGIKPRKADKATASFAAAAAPEDAHPHDFEAVVESAALQVERRNFPAAIELYGRALALEPENPRAHLALGQAYSALNAPGEAVRAFRNALRFEPELASAHLQLGFALLMLGHPAEAERVFLGCEALLQDEPDRKAGLALAWRDLGKTDEALAVVRSIDTTGLENADTLNRIGAVLMTDVATFPAALDLLQRAYAKATNKVPPLVNMALTRQQQGDLEAALRDLRAAQRHDPGNAAANFNESVLLLLRGEFAAGWDKYHWRSRLGGHKFNYPRFYDRELWDGGPLNGKSIFVHGEQGLGDEIMFASCFPDVLAAGARLVIGCDARLEGLFKRSFPAAQVVPAAPDDRLAWAKSAPRTDLYAPSGSLPYYFRRQLASFPRHAGYLRADKDKTARWKKRLAGLDANRKIGLSWRGGTPISGIRRRSMTLEMLRPLLAVPGATFINLQYGEREAEITALRDRHGIAVHDFPEAIDDLDEGAALCSALDLTITVCTAIVHMNGALGCPVWVMAPKVPEWRYGFAGEEIAWYPSARVFRQQQADDWAPLIADVRGRLEQFIAAH